MKVHVEIDCTPAEARQFLGLPDIGKANEVYVDAVANAMKGVGDFDKLQSMAKPVTDQQDIANVGSISANNDRNCSLFNFAAMRAPIALTYEYDRPTEIKSATLFMPRIIAPTAGRGLQYTK